MEWNCSGQTSSSWNNVRTQIWERKNWHQLLTILDLPSLSLATILSRTPRQKASGLTETNQFACKATKCDQCEDINGWDQSIFLPPVNRWERPSESLGWCVLARRGQCNSGRSHFPYHAGTSPESRLISAKVQKKHSNWIYGWLAMHGLNSGKISLQRRSGGASLKLLFEHQGFHQDLPFSV